MAKKKSALTKTKARRAAVVETDEIPEGSIGPENLGKIVFYRDDKGITRVAIVSSVAPDGRTVALHVFDPGQRPDRNLLRAKEGTARGQFRFELGKASDTDPEGDGPDSDEDHSS